MENRGRLIYYGQRLAYTIRVGHFGWIIVGIVYLKKAGDVGEAGSAEAQHWQETESSEAVSKMHR